MKQDVKMCLKIKEDFRVIMEKTLMQELSEWVEEAIDKLTDEGLTESEAYLTMVSVLGQNINICYFVGELGENEYDDGKFMKLFSKVFKETAKNLRCQSLFNL